MRDIYNLYAKAMNILNEDIEDKPEEKSKSIKLTNEQSKKIYDTLIKQGKSFDQIISILKQDDRPEAKEVLDYVKVKRSKDRKKDMKEAAVPAWIPQKFEELHPQSQRLYKDMKNKGLKLGQIVSQLKTNVSGMGGRYAQELLEYIKRYLATKERSQYPADAPTEKGLKPISSVDLKAQTQPKLSPAARKAGAVIQAKKAEERAKALRAAKWKAKLSRLEERRETDELQESGFKPTKAKFIDKYKIKKAKKLPERSWEENNKK